MDVSRIRRGELIAAVAGVALLAVMFLDWYELQGGGGVRSIGLSAWQAFDVTDVVLALAALVSIGLAAVTAARRSPALPVAGSVIASTLGIVATALLLYRILNQPGPNDAIEVKIGAWLGLLCCAALFVAAWMSMADDRPRPADPPAPEPERRPAPSRS